MCRSAQGGFGLIAAIVILVILAALGAFLVTLSTTQNIGAALDVQGARAKAAAETGVEWGLYQALKNAAPPCAAAPGTDSDLGLVADMRVWVNCTTVASGNGVEAGLGAIYLVTSVACNLPDTATGRCPRTSALNATYVERSVVALAER